MKSGRAWILAVTTVTTALGCGGSDADNAEQSGGQVGTAGTSTAGATAIAGSNGSGGVVGRGGTSSLGGSPGTGGTVNGSGGATSGGATSGGASVGGTSGGVTAAGSASSGGTAMGGASVGGASGGAKAAGGASTMGGVASGGRASGGTSAGGKAAGGSSASGGASAGSSSTAGSASGGAGTCTPSWNPPATANGNTSLPAGLDQVWAHSGATIVAAPNLKIHQIIANKGTLSYCVRWDSTKTIGATERDQIETLINQCDQQWLGYLKGWGCFPYDEVKVKVTLWAVKNRALLNWDDASTSSKVVVNSDASCPTDCGPWDRNKTFANCSSARYDEFFWLDGSVTTFTGWGSATGFMMGADYFLNAAKMNPNTYVILAHEMGHSHGLDDFYDWKPAGWTSWIMNSGSSQYVTDTDGWMLRDVWRHVRSKYGYPGP